MKEKAEDKKYERLFSIPDFSDDLLPNAKKAFRSARDDGVITGGSFDDGVWLLSDEYAGYSIDFEIDPTKAEEALDILGATANDFSQYMKFFTVFRLGLLSLGTLRGIIHQIKEII